MSSPNRNVEHAGIIWKVVPGSRREQVLLRMIAKDDQLLKPKQPQEDERGVWLLPLFIGLMSGFCSGMLLGYLI